MLDNRIEIIDGVEYVFWSVNSINGRYAKCCGSHTCTSECKEVLSHGPGHQSKTHCNVKGPHTIHETNYNGQYAEWTEEKASTGFFDEPPTIDDGY